MDEFGDITLSEINQSQKNKHCMISPTCGILKKKKKRTDRNLKKKKNRTDKTRE